MSERAYGSVVAEMWLKSFHPDAGTFVPDEDDWASEGFVQTRVMPGSARGVEDHYTTRFSAECLGPAGEQDVSGQVSEKLAWQVYRAADPDQGWAGDFPISLVFEDYRVTVWNARPLDTPTPVGTTTAGREMTVVNIEIYWSDDNGS